MIIIKTRLVGLGLQISALLSLGCDSDDPVVARVGDTEIRAAQLQRFIDRLPPSLRSKKEGREQEGRMRYPD